MNIMKLNVVIFLVIVALAVGITARPRTHAGHHLHPMKINHHHPIRSRAIQKNLEHKPTPNPYRRFSRDVETKTTDAPNLIHVPLGPNRCQKKHEEVRVHSNPIRVVSVNHRN
ncbi:uncharacterized protein LOC106639170 [Copidosoma floridanum]|uniref:uncharacterized protein LOC106639170 n=1 Tax=Copidosoma floridanum TaxID=29053 RepID=UPI0006C9D5B8|nr:uncharacterized protein LOC106639170 [Copidosoma floridanum]